MKKFNILNKGKLQANTTQEQEGKNPKELQQN